MARTYTSRQNAVWYWKVFYAYKRECNNGLEPGCHIGRVGIRRSGCGFFVVGNQVIEAGSSGGPRILLCERL
jgi:hypothetical protein